MILSEFWALIDAAISLSMNLFSMLDAVVVIDSPRFSLFNFMISVIFVILLINTINWLRGSPAISIGLKKFRDDMAQRNINEKLGMVNQQMGAWRSGEESRRQHNFRERLRDYADNYNEYWRR